ncbi:MAG: IS5 family transposase [Lentisphaeria bacterium]
MELSTHLDQLVLSKKGKMSAEEKLKVHAPEYKKVRRQHSAVNALEQHGLDRCPDHGIDGFKRYVALGVLARNLQRIGFILRKKSAQKYYESSEANHTSKPLSVT